MLNPHLVAEYCYKNYEISFYKYWNVIEWYRANNKY